MFTKIPKCCIKGCDSYKYNETKNFGYFSFPLHDEILLKKWLNQMGLPNWKPKDHQQICTMHFTEADMDCHPNRIEPFLKPTSIPTIFPTKKAIKKSPTVAEKNFSQSHVNTIKIGKDENSNIRALNSKTTILVPAKKSALAQSKTRDLNPNRPEMCPEHPESQQSSTLQVKLKNILPKPVIIPDPACKPDILIVPIRTNANISNGTSLPSRYPGNKRPILRITISKRYEDSPPQTNDATVDTTMEQISKYNETNCTDRVTEKENDTMDNVNLSRQAITIENSTTNRTVTYALDPITGEIVVTKNEIDGSSIGQKRTRSTKTKQKLQSSAIRKTERLIRKRSVRIRRLKKDPEWSSTPQKRETRNSKALTESLEFRR